MSRSLIFASVLMMPMASLFLSSGCNDAANEQQKAVVAQNEANDKIVTATQEADQKVIQAQGEANNKIAAAASEADQKVKDAQLAADKKIAEAQANFMKLREDYRHSTQTDLIELDRKIDELDAKVKKAAGKAKLDLNLKLKQIHAQRDAFAADYKNLEASAATTWDDTKARLDKELSDLKDTVNKN